MQRMNKASGGGGAAPAQAAPQRPARRPQLAQTSQQAAPAAQPQVSPQQAAHAKNVMMDIKQTMSKIQAINMHTRGKPHGSALKQIQVLRAHMHKSMVMLAKLTKH